MDPKHGADDNGSEDNGSELSLRPKRLAEYIGQDQLKANLRIAIEAALLRREPLDHLLFHGPPGLGKTTLANVVANEMGVHIQTSSGPAIERPADLASFLTGLQAHDILFIDEIHRLSRAVEEVLYPAMEDYALDIVIGKGPGARMVRLPLPAFTVIGATTRFALLTAPLRSRFGNIYRLDFYDQTAMENIVDRSARVLRVPIEPPAVREIARRARGTPRIANRLLKRVRDYAQVKAEGIITGPIAGEALGWLEVDPEGLDEIDRKLLLAIIDKFGGGPVGLETVAAAIGEESDTVMDVYEPFLLRLGFVARTPKGRVATPLAFRHLGKEPPNADAQGRMF
jgi:Holliday junction DNA helicase RuvB